MVVAVASCAQDLSPGGPIPGGYSGGKTIEVLGTREVLNEDGTYQTSVDGGELGRLRTASPLIHLRRAPPFDPLVERQPLATMMESTGAAPELHVLDAENLVDAYIIQFHTQALPDYQRMLESEGVDIVTAVPPNAVIGLMSPDTKLSIESMPFVRATADLLPMYKLQEGLESVIAAARTMGRTGRAATSTETYSIMSVSKAYRPSLVQFTESIGGVVLHRDPNQEFASDLTSTADGSRFSAILTEEQLLRVSQRPETLFIDIRGEESEDLDQVREREGFNYVAQQVGNYCGQGVGLEIYDRGYLLTHQELAGKKILVRSPAPAGSGGRNHGTEISGILFAQGVRLSRGLLWCAARPIVFSRYSGFPRNKQPTEPQLLGHLQELVNPNGPYRAIAQTSSTDYGVTTNYTSWSAKYDEVLFGLDFIKLQSQSNKGSRNSRPAAWAKNVVAVGGFHARNSVDRSDDYWERASIGPAADDRIKPDLVGQYGGIRTIDDVSRTAYRDFSGTSGSTPTVAGAFGIVFQMWADGVFSGGPGKKRDVFNARPHAATARALVIHSAFRYPFNVGNLDRVRQGWGAPDLKNLYDMAKANNWSMPILVDEGDVITPGGTNNYPLTVDGRQPLRVTLVYRDPRGNPGAAIHRINDLSLSVRSPSGVVYWGNVGLRKGNWSTPGGRANDRDTVENVFIRMPETGAWNIAVHGDDIVRDGHPGTPGLDAVYALVATGGTSRPPMNQAPVVNAGMDQNIQLPSTARLVATVTDDGLPVGAPVSTQWSAVSGPGSVTFDQPTAVNTTARFQRAGTYVLQITASDTELRASDTVTVVVRPEPPRNQAPVVYAGAGKGVQISRPAMLAATVTDDGLPVGAVVTTRWSKVSGPGTVTFGDEAALSTTATFSMVGTYVLQITANDTALTASDSVTILVGLDPPSNQPPVVRAGSDQVITMPNAAALLVGTATDDGRPAPPTMSTQWSQVSGMGSVRFDVVTAVATTARFPAAGTYVLRLTASDSQLSGSDDVTITVTPPTGGGPNPGPGAGGPPKGPAVQLTGDSVRGGCRHVEPLGPGAPMSVLWAFGGWLVLFAGRRRCSPRRG